jgi:hypothetical protein
LPEATSITVRVPLTVPAAAGVKTVVTPVGHGCRAALPTRANSALVKALGRAFRYQKLLEPGWGGCGRLKEAPRESRRCSASPNFPAKILHVTGNESGL